MERRVEHYYWCVGRDELGKPYLVKGGKTPEDAAKRGYEIIPNDFKVVDYPTTNLKVANQYLKGKHYGS